MNLSFTIASLFFWDKRKLLTVPPICVFNKWKLYLWGTVKLITCVRPLCHMSKQLGETIDVRCSNSKQKIYILFQSYDRSLLLLFFKLQVLRFWVGSWFFALSTNLRMIFRLFFLENILFSRNCKVHQIKTSQTHEGKLNPNLIRMKKHWV